MVTPSEPDALFHVELKPDYDQKRKWESVHKQARELAGLFRKEIARQIEVLGAPMGKSLYLESKSGADLAPDIVEPARTGIRGFTYDNFRADVRESRRGRNTAYPIELRPEEVHFSTEGATVRVPYLGLVAHRPNQKILPAPPGTEESRWLMSNISSMRLVVRNRYLCLVIDTREVSSLTKSLSASKRAKRKVSKWLT